MVDVIELYSELVSDFNRARVLEMAPRLYSDDAEFDDHLVTKRGRDAIVDYLAVTAGRMTHGEMRVEDRARGTDGEYLRWTLTYTARGLGRAAITASGVSHFRLDDSGLIHYQQDHWDTRSGFFDHLPGLGWVLRRVVRAVD